MLLGNYIDNTDDRLHENKPDTMSDQVHSWVVIDEVGLLFLAQVFAMCVRLNARGRQGASMHGRSHAHVERRFSLWWQEGGCSHLCSDTTPPDVHFNGYSFLLV